MGCIASTLEEDRGKRKRPVKLGEVLVFLPFLRIPKSNLSLPLNDRLPKSLVERFSSLRNRMVLIAAQEAHEAVRLTRGKATKHSSTLVDNLQALEDYLSILLGLVKDGNQLEGKVQFVWFNQMDDAEETSIANGWYEILSVLHLMAMLCLSDANFLLLPRSAASGYQPKVSEESRRATIDILLKAAGYFDCAIKDVLPQIPAHLRRELPVDLKEEVLQALCLQALGQGVEIQLGMAIDSPKATLAVKRRLACEMVKYWQQAQDNVSQIPFISNWVEKHRLFVKWKDVEAKAGAYYYHGLVLNEGYTEESHQMAVAALHASDIFLKESKRANEAFHASTPVSRCPPPSGSMKYLSEKISKDASNKVHIIQDLCGHEKILQRTPALPDFALALKPDDYHLPQMDPIWNKEVSNQTGGPVLLPNTL